MIAEERRQAVEIVAKPAKHGSFQDPDLSRVRCFEPAHRKLTPELSSLQGPLICADDIAASPLHPLKAKEHVVTDCLERMYAGNPLIDYP